MIFFLSSSFDFWFSISNWGKSNQLGISSFSCIVRVVIFTTVFTKTVSNGSIHMVDRSESSVEKLSFKKIQM